MAASQFVALCFITLFSVRLWLVLPTFATHAAYAAVHYQLTFCDQFIQALLTSVYAPVQLGEVPNFHFVCKVKPRGSQPKGFRFYDILGAALRLLCSGCRCTGAGFFWRKHGSFSHWFGAAIRPAQASKDVRRAANFDWATVSVLRSRRLSILQVSRRYRAEALAQNLVSGKPLRIAANF
jgi:hypothetical protein